MRKGIKMEKNSLSKVCKVFVSGLLPKKSLWQRLSSLFRPQSEEFYYTIILYRGTEKGASGYLVTVQDMKGLAEVMADAQPY